MPDPRPMARQWWRALGSIPISRRTVLREFGLDLPDDVTVRVHDSTADMRYIVLPARPEGTEGLDEAQLASLVTRDSMIGTGLPRQP